MLTNAAAYGLSLRSFIILIIKFENRKLKFSTFVIVTSLSGVGK